jgi:5S rRNA maturation endonuclease (ribonuclease M5)
MTVLQTGDVRGFYEALGIDLPGWAQREAPARCFASPESHNHGDRTPSTSVNLENGAWCCHGCGARGGAYDAALAVGHTPRSAIELMIAHGLIEPRSGSPSDVALAPVVPRVARRPAPPSRLDVTDVDVSRWQTALAHRPPLLSRLAVERGWRYGAICELEVGLDPGGRLTIPIRDADENLQGVLRYQPWHTHGPKMLAVRGTRLGLIPNPIRESSPEILLVEGPADMLAARSHGMAAIAVPGAQAWRLDWASVFADRRVTVVMDCDRPGRDAARRIQRDLDQLCDAHVLDLDAARDDGYDLTDALLERTHTLAGPAALDWLDRGHQRAERGIER